MTLIKENKGVRKNIPDRMMSATFALPIDGRRVVGILTQTNRFILRQRTESFRQADIEMSAAW